MKRLLQEVPRLAVYTVVLFLLIQGAGWLFGFSIRIQKKGGSTAETSVVTLGSPAAEKLLPHDFTDADEVRNVILLIADGIGHSHLTAARSELVGLEGRLQLERMPITGWLSTHDAGSAISDSAATGTALATGAKTHRGMLAVSPEGQPLRTLVEAARAAGMVAGLVTDSYLWDATPAAFLTHVEARGDYPEVALQMARSGAEVLIGEDPGTLSGTEEGQRALASFGKNGYAVARTWEELERLGSERSRKVAGLLGHGVIADPERPPSLPQLAELALSRLAASPKGFFLLVETEETDTASHRHEFQRMVRGIEALDQVAAQVLDFARSDRSTLVIFTSDHETGGLSLLSGRHGEKLGIRWATRYHTGGPVPLFAYGPGAERFAGARDNTEIAPILAGLLGLRMSE